MSRSGHATSYLGTLALAELALKQAALEQASSFAASFMDRMNAILEDTMSRINRGIRMKSNIFGHPAVGAGRIEPPNDESKSAALPPGYAQQSESKHVKRRLISRLIRRHPPSLANTIS